jgi:hypothetical protein
LSRVTTAATISNPPVWGEKMTPSHASNAQLTLLAKSSDFDINHIGVQEVTKLSSFLLISFFDFL